MSRSTKSTSRLACGVSALAFAIMLPAQASAQEIVPDHVEHTGTVQHDIALEEITVTARRTRENLIVTPLAITALTAEQIEARGISNLQTLQDFTPGYRKVNQTFSRNDRGYQTFVMRGIYGGDGAPRQPVRVFIDGTPIISGDVAGFDALERVEVVQGPQSAYFGRSTFAGAINLITRTPSFDPRVSGSVEVSSFNSQEYRASVEGGLIPDKLAVRVSGLYDKDGGQYENYGLGTRLGEQKTKSVSVNLYAEPVEGVRIKAFEQVWTNQDGPGAQALLGRSYYNCNAGAAPAGTNNYVCGKISSAPAQALYFNIQQFSPQTVAALTSKDVIFYLPGNFITSGGLKRKAHQGLITAEVDIPGGWLLAGNASYLQDRWSNLIDGYQQVTTLSRLTSTPQHLKGHSAELRISSPKLFDHLKLTLGGNYLYQNVLASAPSTSAGGITFLSNPALYVGKTKGLFASAHYDFDDRLTLDLEGRYQWDNVRQAIIVRPQSPVGSVPVDVSATFKSFTPKAILSYKITPVALAYVSYSRGTRPGEFNVSTFALPAATRDALVKQYGLQLALAPEKLDMYELGVKGELFDRRVRIVASAYYGDWKKRHVTSSLLLPGSASFITPITDQGSVELYGIEAKLDARVTSSLTLEGTVGYNESVIKSTACTVCATLTGNLNPTGTRLPAYPAWTGSASATYTRDLGSETDGFVRVDYLYTGRQYDTEANLAYTASANRVNLRAGIQRGRYAFEVFGRNIFDNKTPSSIFRSPNALQGGSALTVSPPERATIGVKMSVKT